MEMATVGAGQGTAPPELGGVPIPDGTVWARHPRELAERETLLS